MAKVHDKYVIELAEVIKGYGNNPDVADPFRLSEFYRFYELPNIAVSQENFDRMQPLDSVQPTQSNTSNTLNALDCVSRQAAIDAFEKELSAKYNRRELAIGFVGIKSILEDLPSAQPEYEPVKAEDFAKTMSENTLYSFMAWYGEALELMERQGFVICKKTL